MTKAGIRVYFLLVFIIANIATTYGQNLHGNDEVTNKSTNSKHTELKNAYGQAVINKDTQSIFDHAFQLKVHHNNTGNFDSTYFYNEVIIATALAVNNVKEFVAGHRDNYFMDAYMKRNVEQANKRVLAIKPFLIKDNVPIVAKYQIAETLSRAFNSKSNLDSTMYYSKMAVRLSDEIGEQNRSRVTARIELAKFLDAAGESALAIQYLTEVEPLIESGAYPSMQKSNFYHLICISLISLKDTEAALYYLNKYKNLITQNGYQSFEHKILKLEGRLERAKGNTEAAISKYQAALKAPKKSTYKTEVPSIWVSLAKLHFNKSDINTMKTYMDSLELNYSNIVNRDKADWHSLNVLYFLAKNNLTSAKNNLDFLNKYNENPTAIRLQIARLNYLFAQKTGNLTNELSTYKKYTKLKDSLAVLANVVLGKRIEAEYNREKQNIEIIGLTETTAAQDKALAIRNNALIMGSIMLAFLGLLFYGLYRLYKKNQIQTIKIADALEENQTLLKEIHHRVRNNLQVISSLLSMQARKIDDDDVKDVLNSSRSRVQSISILHQNLYSGDNATNLDVDDYFDLLIKNILAMYNIDKDIRFDVKIDDIAFDIDVMVPLGLIANELITNALKHAFVGRAQGKLAVSLKKEGSQYLFNVSDDGVGFAGDALPLREGSIGARLIRSFTKKLKGTMEITHLKGTEITIAFEHLTPHSFTNPDSSSKG